MIVDADDVPVGYVHLKDILRVAETPAGDRGPVKATSRVPTGRVHQMVPVQESTDLEDALALMRSAGRHLAQVRDDNGTTTGVLFLEDVIEELIGEVQDATRRRNGRAIG